MFASGIGLAMEAGQGDPDAPHYLRIIEMARDLVDGREHSVVVESFGIASARDSMISTQHDVDSQPLLV